ncbi:MAG: hypothetical protein U1F68_12420 [Gammaproteobacteria bacterium]
MTLKPAPVTLIGVVKVRLASPLLVIVKAWLALAPTSTRPKSVPSAVAGVVSPSAIETLLPLMSISVRRRRRIR